jgi:hypothetical protein
VRGRGLPRRLSGLQDAVLIRAWYQLGSGTASVCCGTSFRLTAAVIWNRNGEPPRGPNSDMGQDSALISTDIALFDMLYSVRATLVGRGRAS